MTNLKSKSRRVGIAHRLLPSRLAPRASRLAPRASRLVPPRSGALLLVCLSLLVLFAVMAITFVMVAGQYRRGSKAEATHERYADNYQKQLNDAFGQIVRDTGSLTSAVAGHGLLTDMYGTETIVGHLAGNATPLPVGGQLLALQIVSDGAALNSFNGYYNGLVLTMLDGPAKMQSTRIVGYNAATSTLHVVCFADGALPKGPQTGPPAVPPNRFVINGRPFNGAGFGYKAATGKLDAKASDIPAASNPPIPVLPVEFALLPHKRYTVDDEKAFASSFGNVSPSAFPDEDYDAPDPQNMALGMMVRDASFNLRIMPSFHRPDLVNYIQSNYPTIWNNVSWGDGNIEPGEKLQRSVILRPLAGDHPDFAATVNPGFNPITGPWDVDNDGDGIPDSIWLDLGYPVQTTSDGRQFKPLFAVLCLDLDGRLNVNAHGTLAELDAGVDGAYGTADDSYTRTIRGVVDNVYFAGAVGPNYDVPVARLPRGQGYGPAEISLRGLWDASEPPPGSGQIARYAALFAGNSNWEGRYGERPNLSVGPGIYPSNSAFPGPGRSFGITGVDDPLSAIKQFDQYAVPNVYGSPSDLWGRGFLGLDIRGMPLQPLAPPAAELIDDPYEIDLSRKSVRAAVANNSVDNPFTAAELEAILRPYDIDASSLPRRLRELLQPSSPGATVLDEMHRQIVTTDSYDVPVAGGINLVHGIDGRPGKYGVDDGGTASVVDDPNETGAAASDDWKVVMGAGSQPAAVSSAADLLVYSLKRGGFTGNVNDELAKVLPHELVAGLKMDINRPFGNGRDDNGNGVVDDLREVGNEFVWTSSVPTGFGSIPFDPNNDYGAKAPLAKHMYARQLYVLLMALVGPDTHIDFDDDPTNDSAEETARGLAQWAINVVDFRDRDSTMTPFEYDLNPFDADGWAVDGIVGQGSLDDASSNRRIVWGCERPELLITETVAWHDRRTEDLPVPSGKTDDNNTPKGETDQPAGPNDYDQRLHPWGAAFIELYNPWNTVGSTNNANGFPAVAEESGEFYDFTFSPGVATGVRLDYASEATTVPASPVWRMIVVTGDSHATKADPDDPYAPAASQFKNADIDRSIYFRDVTGLTKPTTGGTVYYTDIAIAPLLPGRYAVVGSSGHAPFTDLSTNTYVSTMGRKTGAAEGQMTETRRVILKPNSNPNTAGQVEFYNVAPAAAAPGDNPWGTSGNIKNAIAVPINQPRSFSVTEPNAGYQPAFVPGEDTAAGGEGAYTTPLDEPFDHNRPDLFDPTVLKTDGTKENFCTFYLQRLADPKLPYNPASTSDPDYDASRPVNPYLTIDGMSVDVTAFNGVTATRDPAVTDGHVRFASVERGKQNAAAMNLFAAEPPNGPPTADDAGAATDQVFDYELKHTLGYLNKPWHPYFDSTTVPPIPAYLGDPDTINTGRNPFAWLAWFNRPFHGPLELMQVPKCRSSRLPHEFGVVLGTTNWPYGKDSATKGPTSFNHLLNFFETQRSNQSDIPSRLFRLFNFVGVPSPFVGTETYLNPGTFTGADGGSGREGLHPPFNKVAAYREPGRVNINTIADPLVWSGILNGRILPSAADQIASAGELFQSRRGFGVASDGVFSMISAQPSVFTKPFRSAGNAYFTFAPNVSVSDDENLTLMRKRTTSNVPLFVNPSQNQPTDSHRNVDRSAVFMFQDLSRISNLVTTRSNVYAIWITMGYFEVESAGVTNEVYPDGYRLKQELGTDTGEITRHRAFYIYDRTIPVGYQRGRDLNIENGILLKRMIE